MNRKIIMTLSVLSLALGITPHAPGSPLGTAFTYQAQIKYAGRPLNGSADFEFTLWDAETGGTQVGIAVVAPAVPVRDGLFAVELDFGSGAFDGQARWLQSAVRVPTGSGVFATLAPRQKINPEPYALSLAGLRTLQNGTSPNILAGWEQNVITGGVVGATLSGGGSPLIGGNPRPNKVTDNYGTVSGGSGNTAGSEDGVATNGDHATVGGGYANTASASVSTIAGGWGNSATGERSTVAGGWNNYATNHAATVGGGRDNRADGWGATVPGGFGNHAVGSYAFAAGRTARASHAGCFVWGDSTDALFTSTANNQFLIRASGGMGINTASPATTLDISGMLRVNGTNWPASGEGLELGYSGDLNRGYIQVYDRGTPNGWGTLYLGSGNVGIGTLTPESMLTVAGIIESTGGGVKFPDGTLQTTAGSGLGLTLPYSGSCDCGDPRFPRPAFDVTHTSSGNKAYLAGELHGSYGESSIYLGGFGGRILGAGVLGVNTAGGDGVRGESDAGIGVRGTGDTGVFGFGDKGVLGIGDTFGVYGESTLGYAAYFTGTSYVAGPLGVGTDIPVNPVDVEARGTSIGGNAGYDEVVARFRQNDLGHSAVSIDSEAGQDSILYFAQDGSAHWDVRHDVDDSDSLDIRYHGGTGQNWSVLRVLSNGTTRVRVLEIIGGADLAEPFEVNPSSRDDARLVEPGMVVVIDPDNPGELKLSTEPYDRKVAGVISGANGLQPGMMMKSSGQPLAGGDHPVALSGRVWCHCDAAFGAIEPGDLLTTSSTSGHAMKAVDPVRSQGAVLGKAMTALPGGRGLVLVLVSLQ